MDCGWRDEEMSYDGGLGAWVIRGVFFKGHDLFTLCIAWSGVILLFHSCRR